MPVISKSCQSMRVRLHSTAVSRQPYLSRLLGCLASYPILSYDGQVWCPQMIFYLIPRLVHSIPHVHTLSIFIRLIPHSFMHRHPSATGPVPPFATLHVYDRTPSAVPALICRHPSRPSDTSTLWCVVAMEQQPNTVYHPLYYPSAGDIDACMGCMY